MTAPARRAGSQSKKGNKGRGKGTEKKKELPRNIREIYAVGVILASLLLFMAFFLHALGPLGRGLDWFFSYLSGYVRYIFPFAFMLLGVALFIGRLGEPASREKEGWRITWVEIAGMFLFMLSVCALLHLRVGGTEIMFARDELFEGGGILGAVIAWPLVKLLSRAGAYVVVIFAIMVSLFLLTGLTAPQFFRRRADEGWEERRAKRPDAAVGDTQKGSKRRKRLPGEVEVKARSGMDSGAEETVTPQPPKPVESSRAAPVQALLVEESGQLAIEVDAGEKGKAYRLPPLELLSKAGGRDSISRKSVNDSIGILEKTLHDFGVDAAVTRVTRGPTVTRFEVELGSGVKVNRVLGLSDDIAYALASPDIRIITPIPGKSAIGIEIPNHERDLVTLGDILGTQQAKRVASPLKVGLGKDVSGHPIIVDLRDMPHLLLAGATGTGKSCCINSIVASVLMTSTPFEVRMLMIDPKYVELSHFNGIPHLLAPVITDPKKASYALNWVVKEMEHRYQILSRAGVKNIVAYEAALKEGLAKEKDEGGKEVFKAMPYILVVIDELADLMMVAPSEVEDSVARIAQMARAVGIHLVVATQRPSVDVVTGLIKANMPSRIAFTVASQADSRVILDTGGAEKLVGHGDMLFLPAGSSKPLRLQGSYVSEREITAVTAFIKRQKKAEYEEGILEGAGCDKREQSREDELVDEAIDIVVRTGVASASLLQRKLRVGYARAARLIDLMEEMGIVGAYEGSKPRAVLMSPEELDEKKYREARKVEEKRA